MPVVYFADLQFPCPACDGQGETMSRHRRGMDDYDEVYTRCDDCDGTKTEPLSGILGDPLWKLRRRSAGELRDCLREALGKELDSNDFAVLDDGRPCCNDRACSVCSGRGWAFLPDYLNAKAEDADQLNLSVEDLAEWVGRPREKKVSQTA